LYAIGTSTTLESNKSLGIYSVVAQLWPCRLWWPGHCDNGDPARVWVPCCSPSEAVSSMAHMGVKCKSATWPITIGH